MGEEGGGAGAEEIKRPEGVPQAFLLGIPDQVGDDDGRRG